MTWGSKAIWEFRSGILAARCWGTWRCFDEQPMPAEPRQLSIFKIFAARAAAELNRLRMEQMLKANEQRYRDLFDEAPIAYVYEDTDTRFVSVNRAGMKLLGLKPEDVPGTVGWSLVAKNEKNEEQLAAAFKDIQQGKERGLVELELRRKDDGRPVWVQFWSRPEPDGKHTRTMIIDITDRVLAEREKSRLQQQNAYLQEEIKATLNFDEIVGRSPALAAVLEHVRAVGPTDASVLVTGETGTGKELVARAIHSVSRRKEKPLIKVNCAALPAGLVESELFGHEKGAFTGAISRRVGRFELADGGTIFLDEIGELPLEMQAKLLRVLQEGEIDRIGGKGPVEVDVRVIAATNRDLAQAVARQDVSRGFVLPAECVSDSAAGAARAKGRHSAVGQLFCDAIRQSARQADRRNRRRNSGTADGIRLAGQHPRAGEHHGAGGDPLVGDVSRSVAGHAAVRRGDDDRRADGEQAGHEPGSGAARSHRGGARRNEVGHRGSARGSPNLGAAPEHAPQPDEKARHHTAGLSWGAQPRSFVAATKSRGQPPWAVLGATCSIASPLAPDLVVRQ